MARWCASTAAAPARLSRLRLELTRPKNSADRLLIRTLSPLPIRPPAFLAPPQTKEHRVKVKTLITVDVHGRDIVLKMVNEKCDTPGVFTWQSQLKFRWPEPDSGETPDLYINICDAQFASCHEYVGNPGRLVITILTDRCYITLTQALRLMMGGAPQGPAGTGKTETTKDLGRGLAIWVIVSNCSDQMNNKVTGNFFSGLAQTGAWGCFDEFNRITVEVLSVVAGQYGSILEGIRANKTRFMFEEEEINLKNTIGAWITMNPGYAGRAELPENLKALFRPCAMVTPNFENIAEVNLAGEGFVESKVLAKKFTAMYLVCKELLSKQMHYDWGLRAMSVRGPYPALLLLQLSLPSNHAVHISSPNASSPPGTITAD